MLSRRSLFSLFAGAGAVASCAGTRLKAEASPRPVWKTVADTRPRPEHWPLGHSSHSHQISDPTHSHSVTMSSDCAQQRCTMGTVVPRGMIVTSDSMPPLVSLGDGNMILLDSPEGQALARSVAAPNAGMSRW